VLRTQAPLIGALDGKHTMQRGFINHFDLTVSDLAVSCAFYDKILGKLGYTRTKQYEGEVPCWELSNSDSTLSIGLHGADSGNPHNRYSVGLHHLDFHLPSRADVDDFYEFLLQEKMPVLDTPAEYGYTPGYYAVFFADPGGIKLELVYEPRLDRPAV
jgi:catechol 2,3-dioxygenase-like lactoylglutathione lyase family enzyme